MPKKELDEFDEDDDEDTLEDDSEQEYPVKLPKKILKKEIAQTPKPAKLRYSAYMQREAQGILDNETGQPITEGIFETLADIKNDLDEIKLTLGKM